LYVLILIIHPWYFILANGQDSGFAIVNKDTIYGDVKINFDSGSVIVKQDSINRMFVSGIESVTFLTKSRETYYPFQIDSKIRFFKALVTGKKPLIERDGVAYCVFDGSLTVIEERTLFQIFGKKKVKEYVFIRNITITDREDLIDLFRHFNDKYL